MVNLFHTQLPGELESSSTELETENQLYMIQV